MKAISRKWRFGLFSLPFVILATWRYAVSPDVYFASSTETPCIQSEAGKEYWQIAGCEGIGQAAGRKVPMRFNAQGLRDRDYPVRPNQGTLRILVLGASNTVGVGLREEDTLPRQLERELRLLGAKAEVINGATVGYCGIQMAMHVGRLLEAYSPGLVLLDYPFANCPVVDGAWFSQVRREGGAPVGLNRFPFFLDTTEKQFRFFRAGLYFPLLTATDQLKKIAFSWRAALAGGSSARTEAYLAPTVELLNYFREESARHGAKFSLVLHASGSRTFRQTIPPPYSRVLVRLLPPWILPFGGTLADIATSLKSHGVDIKGPIELPAETLLSDAAHYSAEGQRTLAKQLAKLLVEQRQMSLK